MLTAISRSRAANRRRRDKASVTDRVKAWWTYETSEDPVDENDPDLVAAPKLVVPRILSWVGAVLCAGLLACVVMSLDGYNVRTRQFQVREFDVIGNHRLASNAVISASGTRIGDGLLGLETQNIRTRLEALPWVRHARVHLQMPARLILEVEEYVPVAIIADGELNLVDEEGHLITKPALGQLAELPVLTGIKLEDLRRDPPDAQTLLAQRRLDRLLALVGAWPHSDYFQLGEVNWDAARGITLLSADDGAEVRIGHATGTALESRFRQIKTLLVDLKRRGRRLRYALLDDGMRPDRAVISATAPNEWATLPPFSKTVRPAGPRAPKAPTGKAKPSSRSGSSGKGGATTKRVRRAAAKPAAPAKLQDVGGR